MQNLINERKETNQDISIIKKLKESLKNPKLGIWEAITLALKVFAFCSLSIREISLKSKLKDIEKLLSDSEGKIDNEDLVNSNEGIG